MEWMKIVGLTLQASIMLLVVAIATRASLSEVTFLFRRPALLLKSVVARNVAMPIVALLLAGLFPLEPPVRIALLALSVTPVPPFLPTSQLKVGGREPYIFGLFASQTLLAVVLVPLGLATFNSILGTKTHFAATEIGRAVIAVVVPFGIGMLARRLLGALAADRVARVIQKVSMILLLVALAAVLVSAARDIGTLLGNGTLVAFVLFAAIGLAVGHVLGGPVQDDRTSLALATAARHPGIAMGLATTNYPDQPKLAAAAVILYLVVNVMVSKPYLARREVEMEPEAQARSGGERRGASRATADRRRAVG